MRSVLTGARKNALRSIFAGAFALLLAAISLNVVRAGEVRIVRDHYGVPHIYADDAYSLYYGYGYVVGQDRLFQMEMMKRTTSGRVAEVLGKDYLEIDIAVRQGFDPANLQAQIQELSAAQLAPFAGYAAGLNHWLDEVGKAPQTLLPKEFIDFGFQPSPWSAYDVFLIVAGSMAHRYADFNEEINNLGFYQELVRLHGPVKAWQIFNATLPIYDSASPVTVPDAHAAQRELRYDGRQQPAYLAEMLAAGVEPQLPLAFDDQGKIKNFKHKPDKKSYIQRHLAHSGLPGRAGFSAASNIWLTTPAKTRGAKGLLVNGPQFGWINPSYVYGVGLHGAGFDLVGNTLLAYPFMLFAHNGEIAWGSTAGFGDLVDIYVNTLNPENGEQYLYRGDYLSLKTRRETIRVKGEKPQQHTFYYTVHGPVVQTDRQAGLVYSKKRGWEGKEVQTCVAWLELAKTRDFQGWRRQLSRMATNINFYYLDKNGNIGYTLTGRYPRRNPGHDNRLPVPGDGVMDWEAYLPFAQNPHVYNPAQGYIANWNNRPEHGWRNSDFWPRRWGRAERVDILIEELEAQQRFTSTELWNINSRISFADLNRRYLLPVLEQALAQRSLVQTVAAALQALKQWDGYWWDQDQDGLFDTPGPMIMQTWLTRLLQVTLKDDIGADYFFRFAAPGYPVNKAQASIAVSPGIKTIVNNLYQLRLGQPPDYDFFNGENPAEVLAATFIDTVNELSQQHGADPYLWQLQTYPQVFSAYNFRGAAQTTPKNELTLPFIANRGSENNLFVATGQTLTGRDVFAPGQSGFIAPDGTRSPHYADQMDLYWGFGSKRLPFTPAEVEAMKMSETTLEVIPPS